MPFSGKVAVITGAGRGMGRSHAQAFAARGAEVGVIDIDAALIDETVAAILETGGKAHGVACDVAEAAAIGGAIADIEGRTGRIDILVNNAGIAGRAAPVWEQSDEDWQSVIDVDLTGPFNFCRAVLPLMLERNYGRVVNIASLAGKEGNPNMTAYSAAKAGVIALSKSIGKETADKNICCNAVSPTVIRTPILDQLTDAQIDYMVSRIPRGRTGTVEEVAAVVHFLASPDCSFVTGQCYDVSGGRATY
jgi:3-oxoacyl-[acyl-carrier protein] reductase